MSSHQPISLRFIVALVLSVVCLTSSACADIKPPVDRFRAEDEATAIKLRKSSEKGDASAQNALGLLYYEGKGVPQNYGQAKEWFEKAAETGARGSPSQPRHHCIFMEMGLRKAPRRPCTCLAWRQSKKMLLLLRNLG